MFCPVCESEYREGFSHCADCDVDLVDTLASPTDLHPDTGDVETVFATGDPVLLMTAKALLDEAGIPYFSRGEGTQDLLGLGRLGTGFSLLAGPMEIRVGAERSEEAVQLLRDADLEPAVDWGEATEDDLAEDDLEAD
jgi:hypothetical protein